MRAWTLQFMFAKCVLRTQPGVRGGRKKKLKRNETLRLALLDRIGRWNKGEYAELWEEANTVYADKRERLTREQTLEANIRRAKQCAQDARYGKAVAALLSLGMSGVDERSIKDMRSKHPEAKSPSLPVGDETKSLHVPEEVVLQKVMSFPSGSAAGDAASVLQGHDVLPQQAS